jgi:protein-disulfide isomerase-like protein with CxxC motif
VIRATLFTDPVCPWAYSANPALRVLEWRYQDAFEWRLVTIGLRDEITPAAAASFDAARRAAGQALFRDRYGMPFGLVPKARASASGRACRAIVAARLDEPGSEWRVLRALQLALFATDLLADDDDGLRDALRPLGAGGLVDRLDDADVVEAYERDKAEARAAAGTPAEAQGKTSTSDGPVRYTAPSVVFELDGRSLVAGGWQPLLAYDVLVANLDPALRGTPPPEGPLPLLEHFRDGLTTAEAALLLAGGADPVPRHDEAASALLELVADGMATKTPLGQDALWRLAA